MLELEFMTYFSQLLFGKFKLNPKLGQKQKSFEELNMF